MKFATLYFIILFASVQLNAGKWEEDILFGAAGKKLYTTSITFDLDSNLWIGSNKGVWLLEKDSDTLEYLNNLNNGKDTIWFSRTLDDGDREANVFFGGEYIIGSSKYTNFCLSPDTMYTYNSKSEPFDTLNYRDPMLELAQYFDGVFACFVYGKFFTNFKFRYPYGGVLIYEPKINQWTVIHKGDVPYFAENKDGAPFGGGHSREFYKYDSSIVYFAQNSNLIFFNKNYQDTLNLLDMTDLKDSNNITAMISYKGLYYFTTYDNLMYKLDVVNKSYEVEDWSSVAIFENADFTYLQLLEWNDKYSLIQAVKNNAGYKTSTFYIRKSTDDWEEIPMDKFENHQLLSYDRATVSPDKEKIYFERVNPFSSSGLTQPYLACYSVFGETDVVETNIPSPRMAKVFPNPAQKNITIELELDADFSSKISFEIYDYSGRKIKTLDRGYSYDASTSKLSKDINLESLSRGNYLLTIIKDGESFSVGFVVE